MYLIELIAKYIKNIRTPKVKKELIQAEDSDFLEDYQNCGHFYVTIDSTKRYLACSNCGHIIKNPKIKQKKNFFIR